MGTARWPWIVLGLSAQAAFQLLVLTLIWFMQFGAAAPAGADAWWWPAALGFDALLVLGFGLPHSLLLLPPVRRWMAARVPGQLVGSIYCWVSCLSLWLLMAAWQPIGGVLWAAEGPARWTVLALAGCCWLLLGYSMWISGFGWQTGWTPFHAWLRRRADPPRPFRPRSLYRWFRHPIYLSFLLVTWMVPVMTAGHLVLSLGFTVYIAAGCIAKDRRLLGYCGEDYRRYMAAVPGFPGLPWLPWGLGVVKG